MGLFQNLTHANFKAFQTASSPIPDHTTPLKQAKWSGLHCTV